MCVRALSPSIAFRRGQLAIERHIKHIYVRACSRNKTALRTYGLIHDANYTQGDRRHDPEPMYDATYTNTERVYATVEEVSTACALSDEARTYLNDPILIDTDEATHIRYAPDGLATLRSTRGSPAKATGGYYVFHRFTGVLN